MCQGETFTFKLDQALADNGGIYLVIEATEGQSNGVSRAHAKASVIKMVEEPTAAAIDIRADYVAKNGAPSGAVSRTEDASGAAGGCPQSVESAVLWAFEDASRTTGACFAHRISLPYRRSLFFTPNASENASRTPGSLFEHGTHIPYHRWPSPVPNANHLATTAHPALRYRMPDTEASCRRSGAWRTF